MKTIKGNISKCLFVQILVLFLFLIVCFVANGFPSGYTIAGGDFCQLLNIRENIYRYLYTWTNQNGPGVHFIATPAFPFYLFLLALEWIGFLEHTITSFYLFIFLYGSYVSSYLSLKFYFKKGPCTLALLVSMIYALNTFTLDIFTYTYGFSHHYLVYLFIPLLISGFIRILIEGEIRSIVLFTVILSIATVGFVNISFFLSLTLLLLLILIVAFLVKLIKPNKKLFGRLFLLGSMSAMSLFFVVVPLYFGAIDQLSGLSTNITGTNLSDFLKAFSVKLFSLFKLSQVTGDANFPQKEMYGLNWALWMPMSYLPFLGIGITLLFIKKKYDTKHRLFILFSSVLLLWILLSVRVTPPFESINSFLYKMPGMAFFRSPDKLFIFIPFLVTFLLYLGFVNKKGKYIIIFLSMILFIPVPFYLGGIQTQLSSNFKNGENYKNARYSYLIKIPNEYRDFKRIINNEKEDYRIQTLPYNSTSSLGWEQYPKWKFIGFDCTQYFCSKNINYANNLYTYSGSWLPSYQFNYGTNSNLRWFTKVSRLQNNKYVIYHKDVEKEFIQASKEKLRKLIQNGDLAFISSNKMFELYKYNDRYFLPHIYAQ